MPFVATAQAKCEDGSDPLFTETGQRICTDATGKIQVTGGRDTNVVGRIVASGLDKLGGYLFKDLAGFLMAITSLVLIFSGWLLDSVLSFTVTGMSDQIGTGTTIGNSITEAWGIIRDVANMVFIFILLYTAFRTMFMSEYSNVGRSILNIVLIAILINFSLFFAKVVIDASNIVADGFYRAISQGNSLVLDSSSDQLIVGTARYQGISGGVMKMLGMQNIYGKGALGDGKSEPTASRLLLFGTVSGVFMIVASVVFFMASIMFLSTFIIRIYLMILAPFAFIAFIIPGMSNRFWDWWKSLFNQSFFVVIFFALMWVAFKVGSAIVTKPLNSEYGTEWSYLVTDPKKAFGVVINYVLVLGLFIAALTISKQMASKGSTAAAFGAITAAGGAVAFGGTSWAMRSSVGKLGNKFSNSTWLQTQANKERKGFGGALIGGVARATLDTSKKAASGTFDLRNAKVPTSIVGDVVRGTVGRTGFGKALGLDDVNIKDIDVGQNLTGKDFGTSATKGYKESRAESDKRVQERDSARTAEWKLAEAKQAVIKGSTAPVGSTLIGEMEKALAKLSDKETEALVASNRELLRSQNFANAISVKQLEAINKSDQFSESEKTRLKDTRFADINAAVAAGTATAISSVKGKIKGLSDSELEMLEASHFGDENFVAELRPAQFEFVTTKSSKFTTSQKQTTKNIRIEPLMRALRAGNITNIQTLIRKVDHKTLAGFMNTPGRGGIPIALDPAVLPTYNPKMLTRMADEMNDADKLTLKTAIIAGGNTTTINWLNDPDKGGTMFI